MKKLTYLFSTCLMAMCLGLVSCSDDNDGSDQGNPDVPPQIEANAQISSITYRWSDDSSRFFYKNNQMTHGHDEDWGDFTIQNHPLRINTTWEDSEGSGNLNLTDIRTNAQKYIVSAKVNAKTKDEDGIYNTDMTCKMTYNKDGYLTSFEGVYKEGPYTDRITETYTWQDGNLISVDLMDIYYDPEEGTDTEKDRYEFVYTNSVSNSGIHFIYDLSYTDLPEFIYYAGLLGKTTRQIPTQITQIYEDGNRESIDIRVVKDEKGRITELYTDEMLNKVFAYDGQTAQQHHTNIAPWASKSTKKIQKFRARMKNRR